MKGASVKNWWMGLTSNQKLMVIVMTIVIIWVLRNAIKGAVTGASQGVQAASESAVLQANGIKASYSDSEYKKMAKKLYDAMDGPGTEDDIVFAQFAKLNNDVDFIKLDKAFGVPEASDNLFGILEPTDMNGWLLDDLSSESIAMINKKLKSQGVTKRIK